MKNDLGEDADIVLVNLVIFVKVIVVRERNLGRSCNVRLQIHEAGFFRPFLN